MKELVEATGGVWSFKIIEGRGVEPAAEYKMISWKWHGKRAMDKTWLKRKIGALVKADDAE